MKIPTILKGDDAGAITLALDSSHSYDGATLVVAYQGATKTFTGLAAGGTVSLVYNHAETAAFRLGCYPMEARLIGAGGSVETVSNAEWRIKVTDIVSEVNCGGSFAVVPGAASVPVTDVEELGGRYKLTDLAAKINEVCRILAQRTAPVSGPSAGPFGAVALVLLFSLGAFAANVQTARLDDMYNDERVVTKVTFEGLATPGEVSNIVTKAYVEDLGITADFSTNNAALVETIEATAPAPGDYATVSNAAVHAAITNALQDAAISTLSDSKLDKSGGTVVGTLGVAGPESPEFTVFEVVPSADGSAPTMRFSHAPGVVGLWWKIAQTSDGHDNIVMEARNELGESRRIDLPSASGTLALTSDIPTVPTAQINAATTTNALQDAELESHASQLSQLSQSLDGKVPTSRTINGKALTSNISLSADEVGAVSSNKIEEVRTDNAQTRQIVTTWENFLDGSNVVFSITNYLSGSYNLDAAKLRILELRDGAYQEVYNSRDEILLHIDDFSNRYVRVAINAIVDEVAARLASKADRDWGKYTSAGGEAPLNTVYMTAPNTVFAGGLEYERVAVGEGTICVLTTRGAPVWTQGDEGTFKFQDDGGTNYFGFAKTDSYTIGANTDGITVQGGMVTMNYNITMSGRPCVWYKSSLSSGAWEQLNLPDGSPVAGASHAVTWEANPDPGTQVCYINVGNAPSGFFRATVEVTGEAKFMTNMPADLSGGWICPNTATGVSGVIKPTFDGTSVIWTWSAK